ncbi:hypothetical protein THASP1DRAFT_27710 [Thamnocephalis sphaerospora]|uniref:Uncharacterized protein n=1 Tax=Thamnocephalis sphaerospora TaxID=78915 RepID=A0A4P9XW45_9FUNG|nr:hypothetical protein THASP1DRAFT_27710 [Thamnocephalis sphaerospora]|eukprot:RKP10526.1 hypothetical protein THASP1DRAFT_27710 [Thamnocephalis sphaerospora]
MAAKAGSELFADEVARLESKIATIFASFPLKKGAFKGQTSGAAGADVALPQVEPEFLQQVKAVRTGFAQLHTVLKERTDWLVSGPATEACSALDRVYDCLVQSRGWVIARVLAGDMLREQLKALEKFIIPAIDSICILLWFGGTLDTAIRIAGNDAGADMRTLCTLLQWQQYRLLLQNLSEFSAEVRAQLISATAGTTIDAENGGDSQQGHSTATTSTTGPQSVLRGFVHMLEACEYLAVWQTSDELASSIMFSGGDLRWQLAKAFAFLPLQLSSSEYAIWEQCALATILRGSDFSAIIVTDAWSVVARYLGTGTLQSTIAVIRDLLKRAGAVSPLRERLGSLLGRLAARLPDSEMNKLRNDLLAPLRYAGYTNATQIEDALRIFACLSLSTFSLSGHQSTIDVIDRKVGQIMDTLSAAILESGQSKKNADLIAALASKYVIDVVSAVKLTKALQVLPVECLTNVLRDTSNRTTLPSNALRTLEIAPQLLKECAACACEQPTRIAEINHAVHALLSLLTVAPVTSPDSACETLAFCARWMSTDPSGAGKYYAVRFAGNCGSTVFEADNRIKAYNLLTRIFTVALGCTSALTRQEACTQLVKFVSLTLHGDLVEKLVPAGAQDEVTRFISKTQMPLDSLTKPEDVAAGSLGELYLFKDTLDTVALCGAYAGRLDTIGNLPGSSLSNEDVAHTATVTSGRGSADRTATPVSAEACLNAARIVREYLRILRRRPDTAETAQIVKELLALRRDLDRLDVDG